eukprot:366256-Chlamydomonas_euryale.AAC.18
MPVTGRMVPRRLWSGPPPPSRAAEVRGRCQGAARALPGRQSARGRRCVKVWALWLQAAPACVCCVTTAIQLGDLNSDWLGHHIRRREQREPLAFMPPPILKTYGHDLSGGTCLGQAGLAGGC